MSGNPTRSIRTTECSLFDYLLFVQILLYEGHTVIEPPALTQSV